MSLLKTLLKKYSRIIGFSMMCVSALFFVPMMQVIFVSGLMAIFQSDKLYPSQLIVFIG